MKLEVLVKRQMSNSSNPTEVRLANEMERVEICPLCSSRKAEFMFWNYDRLYRLPGKFGTYRCAKCSLIRISPRPTTDTIGEYYPKHYGAYSKPTFSIDHVKNRNGRVLKNWIRNSVLADRGYHPKNGRRVSPLVSRILRNFFYEQATYGYGDRIPMFVPDGQALEIGCGNAAYLSYLKFHGWNVQGLDLSPHSAKAAKDNFDIDVHVGELEGAPFSSSQFDYVHLSHVVEHFFNPHQSMRRVHEVLKPGGNIYVEVPNAAGVGAEISGEFWYGWDAPRHLFMFTPETLMKLLHSVGFTVLNMSTIICDTSMWDIVYREEDETGVMRENRPQLKGSEPEVAKKIVRRSQYEYAKDPLRGDFLSCWATKAKVELT